jgi:hypothetical protein
MLLVILEIATTIFQGRSGLHLACLSYNFEAHPIFNELEPQ